LHLNTILSKALIEREREREREIEKVFAQIFKKFVEKALLLVKFLGRTLKHNNLAMKQ
jgi:hypothetical protein